MSSSPALVSGCLRGKGQVSILTIVLIIIGAIIIILGMALLPLGEINISESRDVPSTLGVRSLDFDLTTDIARVNLAFEELTGKSVILRVSAKGRGPLIGANPYELTFDHTTSANVLTVTSRLETWSGFRNSLSYPDLEVTCDIRIDTSMNSSLHVRTTSGQITIDTKATTIINSLNLETATGGVEANIVGDSVTVGDISLTSTTGAVKLNWINVLVTRDIQVNLKTTTGEVDATIKQVGNLARTVTVSAETRTGRVIFFAEIRGDVGAKIQLGLGLGGIHIARMAGFFGNESALQSRNYPAEGNLEVSLIATTGEIHVDVTYMP